VGFAYKLGKSSDERKRKRKRSWLVDESSWKRKRFGERPYEGEIEKDVCLLVFDSMLLSFLFFLIF
jgi:hypothetical protein